MADTSTLAAKLKELDAALSIHTTAMLQDDPAFEGIIIGIEVAIDEALNLLEWIPEDGDRHWTSASYYADDAADMPEEMRCDD
jgi:hypothetical protein